MPMKGSSISSDSPSGWAKAGKRGITIPMFSHRRKPCKRSKTASPNSRSERRTVRPLEWIVNEVNATVRGWVGYFHYRNCSKALGQIRRPCEERLRTHLRKRHKVRDRNAGYVRFPKQVALREIRPVQSADNSGLDESACLAVKNIGKPCAGKPHARFDEGGQGETCSLLYPEPSPYEWNSSPYKVVKVAHRVSLRT